ncbi:4Fe-4S dicluster domain-containing protein [Sedimenticola thiotaurini]|uniref:4Fe-4S ferredoxin-type domain-containing protein n=1 Tax=Sedimenticola thiotaurini TaxID=1543721 RepID=A0A0F7JWS6_9GAMM|nr:4Fe-4S dicluster domain-containing protein [Sedimenticola thiotaurini]AKH20986.1 hypothetical protein AAY24_12210 [Sedimenticola thiotaurini]
MQLTAHEQADGFLNLSELIIEEELCTNLRGRTLTCTNCQDICPSDALSLSPDAIDLDPDRCTGCNSCLPGCPAGALRSRGFVPERFIATLADQAQVDLHCRASSDKGGGIVIPCHSVLDARLIAAARAEGVSVLGLHGLNNCEGCRYGDARESIEKVVQTVSEWLGEGAPRIELTPDSVTAGKTREYQDQPHLSRRAFLRFGGAQAVNQAVDWIVPGLDPEEQDEEALPFYQSSVYPQRAVQYQSVLVSRADRVPWRLTGPLPWRLRSVSADCSGCLVCGERCPTGALCALETAERRELSFDPTLCTDCSLCERICPEQAMIPQAAGRLDELDRGRVQLFLRRQRPCSRCGTPFVPADQATDQCQVCSNEQELDEAWLDMLSG